MGRINIPITYKNYNLEYWVGSKHVETCLYNVRYAVAKGVKSNLEKETKYQSGTIRIELIK